jgi:multiple antibiotic resistance protein
MKELLTYSLTVFMGFFAIMNPIANVPIFIGLVQGEDKEQRRRTARIAVITAFVIVAAFVVLGKFIFDVFGITIPAFKITGGILLFYVGYEMLMSKKSKVHQQDNLDDSASIAVSPLAIPILAGPGTIVTAMNSVTKVDFLHIGIVLTIFAFMLLLTFWAFLSSEIIIKRLGQNLIMVIGKLMGLILSIMGTDMIIHGIKLAFP